MAGTQTADKTESGTPKEPQEPVDKPQQEVDAASQNEGEGDFTVRIRIDLPQAPAPQLSLGEEAAAADDGSSPDRPAHGCMIAICNPSERVFELKNLVKELDGFWLGAFSFVRGAPGQVDGDGTGPGTDKPYDDWVDVASIFGSPEYEDESVPKVLKVVEIAYDPLEIRSHILRVNDILHNEQVSLRSRQINRGPIMPRDALALDKGISYNTLIRDTTPGAQEDIPKTLRVQRGDPLANMVQLRRQLDHVPAVAPCVKTLALSPYNPPSLTSRLRGHLIYLDLTTLENQTFHIVGMTSGFYLTEHTSPFSFSPSKSSKAYSSLFYLLADKSKAFLDSMKDIFPPEPVPNPDNLAVSEAHPAYTHAPWLAMSPQSAPNLLHTQLDFLKADHTVPDATPYERNWNQEFVLMKELPKSNIPERINRERFLTRLQADMNDFAAKTVAGIVHGDIAVANPNDPPAMQTLVHHNLLFVPSKDALEAFGHLGGDEAVRVTSAKDVNNATILSNADIDNLHLSPSVCIDYMGQRWFCQSLTPGLLSSDKDLWEPDARGSAESSEKVLDAAPAATTSDGDVSAQDADKSNTTTSTSSPTLKILYGSVDTDHPEKAYAASPSFEPLAKQVADLFQLDRHQVHDIEGKATSLWLSGEVKGVLGQDNNKYLLDLYRLQPVDVNFLKKESVQEMFSSPYATSSTSTASSIGAAYPHRLVLLRPELLQRYQTIHAAHQRKHLDIRKEEDTADEKPEEQLRCCIDLITEEKLPEIRFNPDAFVDRLHEAGGVPDDLTDPSTRHVQQAADVLVTQVIPRAIHDLATTSFPMDGLQLTEILHRQGINMRYLGRIAARCKVNKDVPLPGHVAGAGEEQLKALVRVLEQEMVLRGTKHVLRRRLEQMPLLEVPSFLSHILNCLLGTSLNSKPQADLSSMPPRSGASPAWSSLAPASIQSEVTLEVARRFRYILPDDWYASQLRKPQLLRELCLRVGFQLRAREYVFQPSTGPSSIKTLDSVSTNKTKSKSKAGKKPPPPPQQQPATKESTSTSTTFVPDDVLQTYPIVKGMQHRSFMSDQFDISLGNMSPDESRATGTETLAAESMSFTEQVYGMIHPEPARMYNQLGSFYSTLVHNTRDQLWHHERARQTGQSQVTLANGTKENTWNEEARDNAKNNLLRYSNLALSMQRQGLVISERVHGTYSHQTAEQLFSLGLVEGVWGVETQGLEYLYRAREVLDMIHGPHHPLSTEWAIQLGYVAARRYSASLSVPIFNEALATAEEAFGPESAPYAQVLLARSASQVQARHKLSPDAVTELQRARELLQKFFSSNSSHLLEAQIAIISATQILAQQEAKDREEIANTARLLQSTEARAKAFLEKNRAKELSAADKAAAEAMKAQAALSSNGNQLHEMPADFVADWIGVESPKQATPGGSNGKGKGTSRKKKH